MKQAYSHLKSMLWATDDTRVYAYINGAVVPDLAKKLAVADIPGWDSLWRGALEPEREAVAPFVAELGWDASFTDWLLQEGATTYPGWGVIGVGPLDLLAARQLGRSLLKVLTPDGAEHDWPWYDPALWGGLLPTLDAAQLDGAYGAMTDWVTIDGSNWTWLTYSAGQVVAESRECVPDVGEPA
jgi:Domain of unknown function (DUF4123)